MEIQNRNLQILTSVVHESFNSHDMTYLLYMSVIWYLVSNSSYKEISKEDHKKSSILSLP